ncbi:MAG: hypothetical protein VX727_04270 [Planctomycetota bacterium]|nr:hypothetical protein [Planctomycetota bacterium]
MKSFAAVTLLACTTGAGAAIIETYQVGTGFYTSAVQVDFANGNGYLFEVAWQDAGTTGWDLLLTIADELEVVDLDYSTSEWGVFLQGITVQGDVDWGDGSGWSEGIEDYWHYWTGDSSSSGWSYSMIGADTRTVSDGSVDGWVFLSPDAPQALPAPGAIALLAIGFVGRRRRR